MENNNMTAVEWLIDNWIKFNDIDIELDDFANLRPVLEQAKQMEKKQISDAYDWGLIDGAKNEEEGYYNGKDFYNGYYIESYKP